MSVLYAGLDLGQSNDPTALAIIEQSVVEFENGQRGVTFAARHLQRWPLGTSYPAIVVDMFRMMSAPSLAPAAPLIVDGTGVGRAVVDLFRRLGPRLVPVTIHGGQQTTRDADTGYWQVPKRELVGVVQVLLQSRRLRIASTLVDAEALVQELRAFRAKISATGHDSYAAGVTPDDWRTGGSHDDLVLALALACWYALRGPKPRNATAAVGGDRRVPTEGHDPALYGRASVPDWRAIEQEQAAEVAATMAAARAAGWRTP